MIQDMPVQKLHEKSRRGSGGSLVGVKGKESLRPDVPAKSPSSPPSFSRKRHCRRPRLSTSCRNSTHSRRSSTCRRQRPRRISLPRDEPAPEQLPKQATPRQPAFSFNPGTVELACAIYSLRTAQHINTRPRQAQRSGAQSGGRRRPCSFPHFLARLSQTARPSEHSAREHGAHSPFWCPALSAAPSGERTSCLRAAQRWRLTRPCLRDAHGQKAQHNGKRRLRCAPTLQLCGDDGAQATPFAYWSSSDWARAATSDAVQDDSRAEAHALVSPASSVVYIITHRLCLQAATALVRASGPLQQGEEDHRYLQPYL